MTFDVDMSNRGQLSLNGYPVRLHEKDMEVIKKEAARHGISVGVYLRRVIAKHVDSLPGQR
jgi:hypothetical protein